MNTQEALKILLEKSEVLSEKAGAGAYFCRLAEQIENDCAAEDYVQKWRPIMEANREKWGSCFGSVVMRTQGRRPETLRQALAGLAVQTDRDFEVVLVGHKLDEAGKAVTEQALAELNPDFRRRVRYLPLAFGARSAPLNFGFAQAYGEYVMILDDDDIVEKDWIAAFHKRAREAPGQVLFRHTGVQKWEYVWQRNGTAQVRSVGAVGDKYCHDYDAVGQYGKNLCPTSGLAYPAFLFRALGLTFDEKLTTTEDWDYLMRAAAIAGVSSIAGAGSLYRKWTNAETSATVHKADEWRENAERIRKKLDGMPVLLPEGSAGTLMDRVRLAGEAEKWKKSGWLRCMIERGEAMEKAKKRIGRLLRRRLREN